MTNRTRRKPRRSAGFEDDSVPEASTRRRRTAAKKETAPKRRKRNKGQFKKGQSGNPLGRPPKPKVAVSDAIMKVVMEPIEVVMNGSKVKCPQLELAVRALLMTAITGKGVEKAAAMRELRQLRLFDLSAIYERDKKQQETERVERRAIRQMLDDKAFQAAKKRVEERCEREAKAADNKGDNGSGDAGGEPDEREGVGFTEDLDDESELGDILDEISEFERRNRKFDID